MSRFLFAFPVIAALAITPSSALAQHHHGGHHGGGRHGGGHHGGGRLGLAPHGGGRHGGGHHGGGRHGGAPHGDGGSVAYDGSGYQGYYDQPQFFGDGVAYDGSGYQGYYDQPQFVQPPPQAYQIPPGYEVYPDGTVINYGGYNYVISGDVMYPAG